MPNHAAPDPQQPIPGRPRARNRLVLALAVFFGGIVTSFGGLFAIALVAAATHPTPTPPAPAPVVATSVPTLVAPVVTPPPTSAPTTTLALASPPPTPTTTTAPPQLVVTPRTTLAAPTTVFACGGDTYVNVDGNCVPRPTQAANAPPGATAQCRDGSYSFSQHRRGTCSGHGGVARWL